MTASAIRTAEPLSFPFQTQDPFLFCAYHKDNFPGGNPTDMTAPVRGNGADFNWSKPYRMYHGDDVPGFPSHPHRGFETITCTTSGAELSFGDVAPEDRTLGVIDHSDSLGNGARYGQGDLQWMTAGRGIEHCEMLPLKQIAPVTNHIKIFQVWLNLPRKSKMAKPNFAMHWAEDIRVHADPDNGAKVTVWAGEFHDAKGLAPPPDSWAANPENDVNVWFITLQPRGGKLRLPAAKTGAAVTRSLYFTEGPKAGVSVAGVAARVKFDFTLDPTLPVTLVNNGDTVAEFLVLQGKPIGEPVAKHGPFVMNTRAEIQQAFMDYQETRFGGWPWETHTHVHPREKGRFTLVNGVESHPPHQKDVTTRTAAE